MDDNSAPSFPPEDKKETIKDFENTPVDPFFVPPESSKNSPDLSSNPKPAEDFFKSGNLTSDNPLLLPSRVSESDIPPPSFKTVGKPLIIFAVFVFAVLSTALAVYFTKRTKTGEFILQKKASVPQMTCQDIKTDNIGNPEGFYYNEGDGTGHTWGHWGFNPNSDKRGNAGTRTYLFELIKCNGCSTDERCAGDCSYSGGTAVRRDCRNLSVDSNGLGEIWWDIQAECGCYQFDICDLGVSCSNPVFGFKFCYPCPTFTPTPTAVNTPTPTASATPTLTPTVTSSPIPTVTATLTLTPTATLTLTPTATLTPIATVTPVTTATPFASCVSLEAKNSSGRTATSSDFAVGKTITFVVSSSPAYTVLVERAALRIVKPSRDVVVEYIERGQLSKSYTIGIAPFDETGEYQVSAYVYSAGGWH